MSPQYGELRSTKLLTAKIGLPVWGTPANFNGFRVLASLLQRRHSTEANQALHDVWPSPGLVHYIYIFGICCPWRNEFCQVQNSLYVQVLHSPILAALLHGTPAAGSAELSQRAPPTRIFGWAAIALGIGPHSSLFYISVSSTYFAHFVAHSINAHVV